jgi:hypothetical protein
VLKRLGNRLKLVTGGARDLPERQRTLRGTIEWSHTLLEEGERVLFARLAVFSGGRTLEAIGAICDAKGDLPVDTLDGVSSLLDKSLLRQEEGPEGEPRFVMLETIHEYARERLEACGEAEETRRLHAEYFLALAEGAEPELTGPDQLTCLERLESEHDNMRAALQSSLEKEPETAFRLAGMLARFWEIRSDFSEGSRWLEAALRQSARPDTVTEAATRAKLLSEAGTFAYYRADFDHAINWRTIAASPSRSCAWGPNTGKRAIMSARHRSLRRRYAPVLEPLSKDLPARPQRGGNVSSYGRWRFQEWCSLDGARDRSSVGGGSRQYAHSAKRGTAAMSRELMSSLRVQGDHPYPQSEEP